MINFSRISLSVMQSRPYAWSQVNDLFLPEDAAALASTFPRDHFKTVTGYGGEKDYEYEARALIPMGMPTVAYPDELSEHWLSLTSDLLSTDYRLAISLLTGYELDSAKLEVNVFHYGSGACLGPHPDLQDKLVTHILYFNQSWDREDGGCLAILNSSDPTSVFAEIEPIIGNSAILVRSDASWHAVSRVADDCHSSRRSLTATFCRPESISTMWPPGDETPLHEYVETKN